VTTPCRFGLPQETVQDLVRHPHAYDCLKHNLAPDHEAYADRQIDAMTNSELLAAISDAIEQIRQ